MKRWAVALMLYFFVTLPGLCLAAGPKSPGIPLVNLFSKTFKTDYPKIMNWVLSSDEITNWFFLR